MATPQAITPEFEKLSPKLPLWVKFLAGAVLLPSALLPIDTLQSLKLFKEVAPTFARSASAYYGESIKTVPETVTLSRTDIQQIGSKNTITLTDKAFKENFIEPSYTGDISSWADTVSEMLLRIRNDDIAVSSNYGLGYILGLLSNGMGKSLLTTADRYNMAIIPTESSDQHPTATFENTDNGYHLLLSLPIPSNENGEYTPSPQNKQAGREAITAILTELSSKELHNQLSFGTYDLHPENEKFTIVYRGNTSSSQQQHNTL